MPIFGAPPLPPVIVDVQQQAGEVNIAIGEIRAQERRVGGGILQDVIAQSFDERQLQVEFANSDRVY